MHFDVGLVLGFFYVQIAVQDHMLEPKKCMTRPPLALLKLEGTATLASCDCSGAVLD